MLKLTGLSDRLAAPMNRWHAINATRRDRTTQFLQEPEPRFIGNIARGRQLIDGQILFLGAQFDGDGRPVWDHGQRGPELDKALHGFEWLDDLAAVGNRAARTLAVEWLGTWIERYARGRGPGWTPAQTGSRLMRWISHGPFLLRAMPDSLRTEYFHLLAQQTLFLEKRWKAAPPGAPRFEALCGLAYAALSLEGLDELAPAAVDALGQECATRIDAKGALASRNPEELLHVLLLLTWITSALEEAAQAVPEAISDAVNRIAPVLRTIRHADGCLPRFHGGGRGEIGRLDAALCEAGQRVRPSSPVAMGYTRLAGGRTSVIVDTAPPTTGPQGINGHASTLAFEMTSGRRPLIVSCGAGGRFGSKWRRAGRATPSHSTVCVDGFSSARLGRGADEDGLSSFAEVPQKVPIEVTEGLRAVRLQTAHDGYLPTHGLTHARTLTLSRDGRQLRGEDLLLALDEDGVAQFERAARRDDVRGVPYHLRFHLHPAVDARISSRNAIVSLTLRSGERWVLRFEDGDHTVSLEPSVYLESGRLEPLASLQVVLSGLATEYATRLRWSLSKTRETAIGVRDLGQDLLLARPQP